MSLSCDLEVFVTYYDTQFLYQWGWCMGLHILRKKRIKVGHKFSGKFSAHLFNKNALEML